MKRRMRPLVWAADFSKYFLESLIASPILTAYRPLIGERIRGEHSLVTRLPKPVTCFLTRMGLY